MSTNKVNLFEQVAVDQVQAFYRGTQTAIEALTGLPVPSFAFGWTSGPSDGEFGIYNGVAWSWGTGSGGQYRQFTWVDDGAGSWEFVSAGGEPVLHLEDLE